MKRNGAADDSRPLAGVGKVGFYELLLYRIAGIQGQLYRDADLRAGVDVEFHG